MFENIGRTSFHARCCVPALSGCCALNSIPIWTLHACMIIFMYVVYTSHVNLNSIHVSMNFPFAQTVQLISPPHAILPFTWRWLPVYLSFQVHARPGGHPFLRSVPGICLHAREPAVADYQWEGGIRTTSAPDYEGALRHWRRIR